MKQKAQLNHVIERSKCNEEARRLRMQSYFEKGKSLNTAKRQRKE